MAKAKYDNGTDHKWVSYHGYTFQQIAGLSVWDATLLRWEHLFDTYPDVIISYSGGKDSTIILETALIVARQRNRLPLKVWFFDDELIDPDTVAHIGEVSKRDELDFKWFCLPTLHTVVSSTRNYWYTWDEDERAVWPREYPEGAITIHDIPEIGKDGAWGVRALNAAVLRIWGYPDNGVVTAGIRMEEAFNRRRNILYKGSWIHPEVIWRWAYAKPIYDWSYKDVWKAILENAWAYSGFYDKCARAGINLVNQRVATWGNVRDKTARYYPEFYPDYWEKVLKRMPEISALHRYGLTAVYRRNIEKPVGITWQQHALNILSRMSDEDKKFWFHQIKLKLKRWYDKTTVPYPDDFAYEGMGSWREIVAWLSKNDHTERDIR